MRLQKPICTILFICLVVVLLFLVVCWIFKLPILMLEHEGFYAKRNDRIRIYQSDEIFDPDEAPEMEDLDPDDNPMQFDPDQEPLLDDQMNQVVLRRTAYKPRYFYS